jgi:D-alanyl-D-alanine carboxypeptidase
MGDGYAWGMKRPALVALLASASACGGSSSNRDAAPPVDLAPYLAPIATQYELPAVAGLAADGTAILGQGVVGVRKLGDATPATLDDAWHLGSDTKAMTATLAALLVEDGTTAWDRTLPELFPKATIDVGYAGVTLAMLLAHVGGAPGDFPADVWAALVAGTGTSRADRLAAVEQMLARPPGATVGAFTYSNAGYMMAGAALELATDTAWEDLMRARLFTPLGMTSCGFGPVATPGTVDQPWGHTDAGGTLAAINADNPAALGPAGTVHCDLGDWLAFVREHLHAATGAATRLPLAAATWTRLHTAPAGSQYALGWMLVTQEWTGGVALAHMGSNTFNVADVWLVPGNDRIFMSVTNRGDTEGLTGADAVIADLVGRFPAR